MTEIQKRLIAHNVAISEILGGRYVKEEGWNPSYIITENNLQISRVNIIATTISKSNVEDKFDYIIVDDGSGEITLRNFGEIGIFKNINIGDTILIVGKVREYAGENSKEKYLVPEILKHTDKRWINVRNIQLDKKKVDKIPTEKIETIVEPKKEQPKVDQSPHYSIISMIKEFDKGDGADIQAIIDKNKENKQTENIINSLLLRGDIFEIKPGKLKVLE
jgi:RPA family protein